MAVYTEVAFQEAAELFGSIGLGPLETLAPCAAGYCSRSSFIIDTTPRIAPVGKPLFVRRSGSA